MEEYEETAAEIYDLLTDAAEKIADVAENTEKTEASKSSGKE